MKINKEQFYTYLFAIVLLLQLYVPSFRFNIYLQLLLLSAFVLLEKPTMSVRFFKTLSPIVIIISIGFIGMLFYKYKLYNIIKDVFHFIRPLVAMLMGYLFYRKINNFRLFVRTIVIVGFLSSLVHFYIMFFVNSSLENVSSLRENSKDNILELFALFFFSYYKKFKNERLFSRRLISRILYISILLSCIMYFSRTMIAMTILLLLTIHGHTIITKKTIKIISALVLLVLAFYVFLFSINIQRNKKGLESFLYKLKVAPAEIFKTKIDRQNHADLWDHWRGYEAKRALDLLKRKPEAYVIGCGYGSLVNLKFYAPLSGDAKGMKYISELHNGYIFVLYKTGIFGLAFYMIFLFILYTKIYLKRTFERTFISGIALCILFATLVIGSFFNGDPIMLFLLGTLLFFDEKNNSKTPEAC